MAKRKRRQPERPERQISIRSIRRDPPDYRKLGRAFLAVAMLQAEAEAKAAAEHAGEKKREGDETSDLGEDPRS